MNDDFYRNMQFIKNEASRQDHHDWVITAHHLIFRAAIVFDMYVDQIHAKYGINHRDIAILTTLARNDGKLPQKRFAKILGRTKQTIASSLAKLEKRHYIERKKGKRDHRSMTVWITEEGLKIDKECLPLRGQFYNSFASFISKKEGQQLNITLSKLCDKVIADMKKSKSRG